MAPKDRNIRSFIPEGELPCIWMLAGVVNYKLCKHKYECDRCPFDKAMTESAETPSRTAPGGLAPGRDADRSIRLLDFSGKIIEVDGYRINGAYFYHEGHTWASVEERGNVRVGLDDFGQKLLGRIVSVRPAEIGKTVDQGERCWTVEHREGVLGLVCPVFGCVLRANEKLLRNPSLVNFDPYGGGWVMVVQPSDLVNNLKNLYYGSGVVRWCGEEAHKLQRLLMELCGDAARQLGETMRDGGELERGAIDSLSVDQFRFLIDEFFKPGAKRSKPPEAR